MPNDLPDILTHMLEPYGKYNVAFLRRLGTELMNAYDRTTVDELIAAFRTHIDARVVVITGTGRAFCAGGYLANLAEPDFWALANSAFVAPGSTWNFQCWFRDSAAAMAGFNLSNAVELQFEP